MELAVEMMFLIGIVAIIATVIRYPRDVGKGLLGLLLFPFVRIWNIVNSIFLLFRFLFRLVKEFWSKWSRKGEPTGEGQ